MAGPNPNPWWTFGHRSRHCFYALVCLLGGISSGPAWARENAGTLTVATYNISNYTLTNRMTADGFRPDYPKPELEKTALRRVIQELDADVLALQEVGGPAYLRELQRDLRSDGCDYPFLAIFVHDDEPRHVAALSRRPFVATRKHDDLFVGYRGRNEPVRRGLLELRVALDDAEVTLFLVHLKSRYTERDDDPASADLRGGEAVAVRDRILEVFPDPTAARFMVLGDFNDHPRSRPVRALLKRGELTISHLLNAADSRGERWTHHYARNDAYSRVDHVLVSPGLLPWVAGSAQIIDGDAVNLASDHRPVLVTLRIGED